MLIDTYILSKIQPIEEYEKMAVSRRKHSSNEQTPSPDLRKAPPVAIQSPHMTLRLFFG
jgi:hypothetical protein